MLAFYSISGTAVNTKTLSEISEDLKSTETMPVLFLGHGTPINAIEDNEFSQSWKTLGKSLPRPNAILCVSAHWETNGSYVTAMEKPKTIHDFGGFPKRLFDIQYPAPGSPALAADTANLVKSVIVGQDLHWGLDHGAWSVIMNIYPDADIPVVQLSLDRNMTPEKHYQLANELIPLRDKGILIIGSGNIVHNLSLLDWHRKHSGYDWAVEANEILKELIAEGNIRQLFDYQQLGRDVRFAVPTPEHYLPMIYALGLKRKTEDISLFNDKLVLGSLSMTSFKIS